MNAKDALGGLKLNVGVERRNQDGQRASVITATACNQSLLTVCVQDTERNCRTVSPSPKHKRRKEMHSLSRVFLPTIFLCLNIFVELSAGSANLSVL